jgi:hypothetical protein
MSFCWSAYPAPFPGSYIFPALAGPGASSDSGAPAVLAGDSAARPVPQPRPGADVERRDPDSLGDPCFDPEQAGE